MRAAAAAVLVLVLALPAAAAPPRRAALHLASLAPLIVTGRGFGNRERVGLKASAQRAQRVVRVVARRDGSLTARFTLRLGPCAPLMVTAVGQRGSRAILQVEPGCKTQETDRQAGLALLPSSVCPPRRMRFSFESRCRIVQLVLEGASAQAAAAACGASRATGYRLWRLFQEASWAGFRCRCCLCVTRPNGWLVSMPLL